MNTRWQQFVHRVFRPMSVGWFLAVRQIRRSSKWTTGLIIFIMTLTFLNLVVVAGLLVGLLTGSFEQFREGYSGEVLITPKPGREYIENTNAIHTFLAAQPEVTAHSTRYIMTGNILATLDDNPKAKEKPNQTGATIVGIDPESEEATTRFSRFVIEGEALRPGDDGYIVVGATLLKEYSAYADVDVPGLTFLKGVKPGGRVRVTMGEGPNAISKDYVVKGIVKSKIDQVSQRMFIVDSDLRKLRATNQWEGQEIAVRVKPGADEYIVGQLHKLIGNAPVRVQTSADAIPTFLRDIETTMGILGNALSSIALVVASITIFIVIFINAVTRRKFIGIMKGIGIEPRAIQGAYIIQALFYGVVGSAIGLLLTFGLLKPYFAAHPIDFPFSDGVLAATWPGALLRIGILLVVTLVAGFLPAMLIVRKNTLDSILGR